MTSIFLMTRYDFEIARKKTCFSFYLQNVFCTRNFLSVCFDFLCAKPCHGIVYSKTFKTTVPLNGTVFEWNMIQRLNNYIFKF